MDRFLGVVFTLLTLISLIMVFATFIGSNWLPWLALFLWTIALGVWTYDGWFNKNKKNILPVGYRGQILIFGSRVDLFTGEGRRFLPKPIGIEPKDCRATTTKMKPLVCFTQDDIEVVGDNLAVVTEIFDLGLNLKLNPKDLPDLLDDVIDTNVRKKIGSTPYNVVKNLDSFDTTAETLERYGIRVVKIVVPAILPKDEKFRNAVQLEAAEERERLGQTVEANHNITLVNLFKKPKEEGGCGMTHGEAVKQSNLITGKANPENLTTFGLPPEVITAIGEILGGKK